MKGEGNLRYMYVRNVVCGFLSACNQVAGAQRAGSLRNGGSDVVQPANDVSV